MPTIAMTAAEMPAEKLLTSISKPGLILPSHSASSFFITQPPSGPMIIAPRNIGEPPVSAYAVEQRRAGRHDHAQASRSHPPHRRAIVVAHIWPPV